jgi:ABC-type oligopeptide transport system substrate-binding subunit
MPKRTRRTILILALSLLVLVGACSLMGVAVYRALMGGGDALNGVAAVASESSPNSAEGGVLRLVGGLPPTLDPALVQDSTSAEYVVHLYSGLVSLDRDLEVVPDLATRWEISADGLVYTFYLEPEAVFADGRRITATDWVYSIERACSPALASPVALAYLDDIVGAAAFASGNAESIAGMEALDEHTVRVTIDAPKAYFLAKLTYPTAYVVDREQVEGAGPEWMLAPNGSGPFALESIDRERIVLRRNERYYGAAPALERIEYVLEGGLPITLYENDRLDIVAVSPSEIERVSDPENPLFDQLVEASELSVQYLGLNVDQPPFDDLAVRQAFAQAIDRDKLAHLVLNDTALPAYGVLPPAMPDYNRDLSGLPYDPGRAQELLASSSYAGDAMPEVVLAVSGTSGYMSSTTRAVLGMIEENLGIQMRVEQVEWSNFLQDLIQQRYQMFSAGWIGDYPDSQNFLDILFHSASSQNHTGYANPQVDALLEQARVAAGQTRTDLYQEAERIIVADAAWIPLTHGVTYNLVKPHVKGFSPSPGLYPWLRNVYLERQVQ